MKIILDVMGSDKGPGELIKGAEAARERIEADIIYVGDADVIQTAAAKNNFKINSGSIIHAPDVISMESDPFEIRSMRSSSMRVALEMLSEGAGDALVSCGNTGALHTGATLYVKRIPGIHRAAISALLPMKAPVLLLDAGANLSVTPEQLTQFAIMGSIYMNKVLGVDSPKVGLLNIGGEDCKGTPLYIEAYKALRKTRAINFVGNIEGKEIPFAKCDVVVCDGFTGNIVLKTIEGMGKFVSSSVKDIFSSFSGKVGGMFVLHRLSAFRLSMSPSVHAGAPLLGISKPVIKSHGSSDAKAFCNAICKAERYAKAEVSRLILESLESSGAKNVKAPSATESTK